MLISIAEDVWMAVLLREIEPEVQVESVQRRQLELVRDVLGLSSRSYLLF